MKRSDQRKARWIGAGSVLLVFIAAFLAGCASQPRSPLDDPEAMSALMVRLGDDLYNGSDRCLPRRDYSAKVIDEQHLLFRQRDQVWVNKLRARCPGLRWAGRGFEMLAFEPAGSRLCELDTVGAVDPRTPRGGTTGRCALGEFLRVDQEMVEQTVGVPR